ncbi:MAG: NTF2-like N-terminal transpeptidase domain-containing protein [Pyrinomonadaceae bacterium]
MNKTNLVICCLILGAIGSSCSMMKDSKAAEPAVEKFHRQFNAKDFKNIYAESGDLMKKSTDEKKFVEFLDAIYRKLGTHQKSKAAGWHVNTGPLSSHVTLTYESEFSDGKAAEEFLISVSGDEVRLEGYHINSPDLIIK